MEYEAWQKSNETGFLLNRDFISFKHQYHPLQISSLGQLHTGGNVVLTVRSSAGSLQQLWYSFNMSTVFGRKGIVHKEFVPPRQTVSQFFYKTVLERLKKGVIRVRQDIAEKCLLHHNNASCYTALSITEFLTPISISVFPIPRIPLTSIPVTFSFFLN